MKKIAVINDLSGFGKCSLTAAIPIISANGMQCCPLPTGIFSNQTGYESYKSVDMTEYMQGFIDEWKKLGAQFDAILTGFISNPAQGKIICDFIDYFKQENTLVVVDPVMADDGEIYDGFDEERIHAVCSIAKKADIITPNVSELCLLSGNSFKQIHSLDEIEDMSKKLFDKWNTVVVATGIVISKDEIANSVYDGKKFSVIRTGRQGGGFSGTGDILSSYITVAYLNGKDIFHSVKNAGAFIEKAIAKTMKKNRYNPADGIDFEAILNK